MKSPKILVVTGTDARGPSARIRGFQTAEIMKEAGASVRICGPAVCANSLVRNAATFTDLVLNLKWADVLFLQKAAHPLLSRIVKYASHNFGTKIVYDIDDPVCFAHQSKQWMEHLKIMRLADLVVSNSPFMSGLFYEMGIKAMTIPTGVKLEDYEKHNHFHKGAVRLSWAGSHYQQNIENLNIIKNPLNKVLRRYKQSLVCDIMTTWGTPPFNEWWKNKPNNLIKREWTELSNLNMVSWSDIGLSPFVQNWTNQIKTGSYKIRECGAAYVPSVYSPVGLNGDFEHGKAGLAASSEGEWEHYLSVLIEDASLREMLGQRARKIVEKKYDLRKNALKIYQSIKRL